MTLLIKEFQSLQDAIRRVDPLELYEYDADFNLYKMQLEACSNCDTTSCNSYFNLYKMQLEVTPGPRNPHYVLHFNLYKMQLEEPWKCGGLVSFTHFNLYKMQLEGRKSYRTRIG